MCKVMRFVAFVAGLLSFGGSALAVTPYDDLVTAADISGLATTQVTILVGVLGLVVVVVAFAILANSLRKAKAGSR